MGDLDFLQVVNANWIVVTFAGEKNFYKIADHAEFGQFASIVFAMHREEPVRLALQLAARDVVFLTNTLRQFRNRKMFQPAAHVPARVAVLQPPDQNLVQRRAGNNSELPLLRNGSRQPPARYADAHSALNDHWIIAHQWSFNPPYRRENSSSQDLLGFF